ncbi:hypothetical protein IID04_01695, partial [PVC group bacterium]|nr:hypothetical protein [PVC group bacterium]
LEIVEALLDETSIELEEVSQVKTKFESRVAELDAMFRSVNQEVIALEKSLKGVETERDISIKAQDKWQSKFLALDKKISQDQYLARLIQETALSKSAADKYRELLVQKNQEIVFLQMELDMQKVESDEDGVSNRVIASLSRELAAEKLQARDVNNLLEAQKEKQGILNDKLILYENAQKKLIARYDDQIQNLKESLGNLSEKVTLKSEENSLLKHKLDSIVQVFTNQVERINLTKSALDSELIRAKHLINQEQNSVALRPILVPKPEDRYASPSQIEKRGNSPQKMSIKLNTSLSDLVGSTDLLEARILSSSKGDQDFVILDKGRTDGIYEGLILDVWDANGKIGDVSIIQTRDNVSAAKVRSLEQGKIIQEGHRVISKEL